MNTPQRPVAVITGAGSGIGRATAVGLGSRGYRLVLCGRNAAPLIQTGRFIGQHGVDWLEVQADLSVSNDRIEILSKSAALFGRLDAIINNAARCDLKVIEEMDESEIRMIFETNAIGPIDLVRRAIPDLISSRGCVVNVASIAMVDPFVGLGIYGCSKAAIDGLTRAVHNEYGEQGVRAYTIAPGAVETTMLRSIVSKEMLPTKNTLSAEQVAGKIIACMTGEASEPSGSTIVMNSP